MMNNLALVLWCHFIPLLLFIHFAILVKLVFTDTGPELKHLGTTSGSFQIGEN